MSLFDCLRSGSYFRFSTAGAAAFGLANALDTVPGGGASFFLSALGFLASRLVLFWPFAITVLPSEGCREPYVGPLSAGRQPGLAHLVPGRLADGHPRQRHLGPQLCRLPDHHPRREAIMAEGVTEETRGAVRQAT